MCLSPVAPHVLFTFHCTHVTVTGCSTKQNCQDLDAAASFIKLKNVTKHSKTLGNRTINDKDRQRTEETQGKQRS